jgi:hypothetical protein
MTVHYNKFRWIPYWGIWARILRYDEETQESIEVNLMPINAPFTSSQGWYYTSPNLSMAKNLLPSID